MTTIEIRPGEGGTDAATFADELTHTIHTHLRRHHHTHATYNTQGRTTVIETDAPTTEIAWLAGTHRVQRIPTRTSARHTSTATIAVLTDQTPPVPTLNDNDLRIDRYRGTGPGGQHRNKNATAIRLVHAPTGITVTREHGRSQSANLTAAKRDLQQRLRTRRHANAAQVQQDERKHQVTPDRSAKTFTHNHQRGEVTDHQTGRRWTLKQWRRGHID